MGRVRVLRLLFTLVLGLRLHLVCTLQGLPVAFALTGAKADEREVLLAMFTAEPSHDTEPGLATSRPGQILTGERTTTAPPSKHPGRRGDPASAHRPQGRARPADTRCFKPLRQIIESVNNTFKGQLELERRGGHPAG